MAPQNTALNQVIPALPGWYIVYPSHDGENVSVYKEPIVAWVVVNTMLPAQHHADVEDWLSGSVHPITPAEVTFASDEYYMLSPDGQVFQTESCSFDTVEDWLKRMKEEAAEQKEGAS